MWLVEFVPASGRLSVRLRDVIAGPELRKVADAQAAALEATGGEVFKVFVDLRGLVPLDDEAVGLLAQIKKVALGVEGCRGVVVLADSPTVAMQQMRTRSSGAELVTLDQNEATRALAI
jgi:hypothetical protein